MLVNRFFVRKFVSDRPRNRVTGENFPSLRMRRSGWYVVDIHTGDVAGGTERYLTRQDAIDVAREYQKKYGAYIRFPF